MKITNPNANMISQAYTMPVQRNQNSLPDKGKIERQNPVDSVTLSAGTRDLQNILKAMPAEPKDRADRVAELKNEVSAGQYTVDAEKVAEKMAGYFLDELG